MSITKKFYDIRDKIIPNGNVNDFEKWLSCNETNLVKTEYIYMIESFYGAAISYNNTQIIAIINLFVRENNIIVDESKVLEHIYNADCRERSTKHPNHEINFCDFNEKMLEKYSMMHKHKFK